MKTKTILITLIAILAVTALVFQSCKKETNDDPPSDNKIPETTKVIEAQIWQSNFTGIDSSDFTLYFDKKLLSEISLETGDIIVSTDGYGLLRKVNKITESADGLEIETGFASLTEVVNEGQTSFSSLLSTQKIMKINYHKDGVILDTSLMKSTEDTQLEYDIDVFLDPNEKIHIQGDFSILTELNGQLEIGYIPPRISLFEITYEIDQSLNLSADIELINLNYEHKVDLVSVYFQPIIAIIAGVPVVLVPELEIAVGIEAEVYCDVYTGINQEMDYTVGLRYEEHEWTTISEFNKSFNYTPPQLDCNAGARAYIRPQFNILIYGVVSPYLYGDLFGKIESDVQSNPWWNLYAGADLGVGIEAEILGREIFDFNTNPPLISYEQLIASASISEPPTANFYSNPTSGAAPLTVAFTDQSTDNPTSWQWEFGDSGSSTQQNPSHTYNTDGSYTVTLTVTNSYGSDTESKTDYIIVSGDNTPPTALFTVSPSSGTTTTNFAFDASGSTDNEDPTSNLQVRWDFEGNGSWDTGWDYDKTINHQYANESTYTAKLEVKDTEELTDQYTKTISVSNGGGGTGTYTDPRDGQTYATIEIGSQTWFAENLNYETSNSWEYENSSANGNIYGRLYTWDAALTACPSGWSLPSDDEWKTMEMALGMSQSEADDTGYRGTDEGGKMKETGTIHWNSPNTGATNTSGFTALPGGGRGSSGSFDSLGSYGGWWSSGEDSGTLAWGRSLHYGDGRVGRGYGGKTGGFSVRCLKD